MLKIAHRGYSDKYKDNTLEAFEHAVRNNFDMIELDIQLCKSGEIIIYHDTVINSRMIIDCTLDELKKMDSDIITLGVFFKKINSFNIKIFLDVKGFDEIINPLVNFIKKNLFHIYIPNLYISSFNLIIIEALKKINIPFKLGLTTSNYYSKNQINNMLDNIDFVCIDWTVLDKNIVDYLKGKNKMVFSCTCENYNNYCYMKQYNLDGIVSNILI